jgi:hypothetical protein
METRKTLKKLIKNYSLIFANLGFQLNPNFKKDFLHIERMKSNSTKISFIKKDKIEGLQKNVPDFKLKPKDKEQREKYFTAVKPSKLISSLVLQPDDSKARLFSEISEQFNKDFLSNIKNKLVLYSGNDIAKIYNEASVVGCMSRSCKSWFKVYAKTENLQLATLQDGETILSRSLLWYDKKTNNYWLDNSYEQSAINGDNEIRKDYQKKLICQVLSHLITKETNSNIITFGLGCSFANSLNSCTIEEIEKQYSIKIFRDVKTRRQTEQINTGQDDENGERIYNEQETERSKQRILLKPIIKDFDYSDFDSFPYSDTFQSISKRTGKWLLDDNNGDDDFVCCRSTEGQDENDSGETCSCCDERITNEDYIHYSEVEEEMLCDDCCTYIEERDDICRSDNALHNNYSGVYIYRHDID